MNARMSGWVGGVLIGMAAALLLWLNGRIAGISGIVNAVTGAASSDRGWRVAFLLGLMLAGGGTMRWFAVGEPHRQGYPVILLVVGGLLVGFGTRMGSGCTSGHGVCGLGRLSLRSLARGADLHGRRDGDGVRDAPLAGMVGMNARWFAALFSGALFGVGLAISGMTDPRVVQGFLDIFGQFDPTLILVLGAAVGVTVIAFRWILRLPKPRFAPGFELPATQRIDRRLIVGAGIFGIGWGLVGYCPGPALVGLAGGVHEVLWFVPAMLVGAVACRLMETRVRQETD
ncbi:YeeE/YedE family protein [Dokdonella soli]|uniref:YeeE/YedE family protein n=1 Tax=Dokdonella soli TaxID=529810 RepID=A0ABN1ISU4_9GAMM